MPDPKQSPGGPASAPSAKPEPLSAVLAEMRREAGAQTNPLPLYRYADRIEAAAKRELSRAADDAASRATLDRTAKDAAEYMAYATAHKSSPQSGSAAAMCEALEYVCHMDDEGYTSYDVQVAIQKARAALAAPARNCDRSEFWEDLWLEFGKLWPDVTDDLQRAWLFVRWLFATAKGGDHA